jgi:hypothetical protein
MTGGAADALPGNGPGSGPSRIAVRHEGLNVGPIFAIIFGFRYRIDCNQPG